MVFTIFGSSFPIKLLYVLISVRSTTGIHTVVRFTITHILAIRNPPQVLNPIIYLITVDMVYERLVFGVWDIAFGYKTVNQVTLATNLDLQVAPPLLPPESPMGRVLPSLWQIHASVFTDEYIQCWVTFGSHRVRVYPLGIICIKYIF